MICEVCGLVLTEKEYRDLNTSAEYTEIEYECELCNQNEETLQDVVTEQLEDFIFAGFEDITIEDFELYLGRLNNIEDLIEVAKEETGYTKEIKREGDMYE